MINYTIKSNSMYVYTLIMVKITKTIGILGNLLKILVRV